MAADGVGSALRHLGNLLLELATYFLSQASRLSLHCSSGLLNCRVLGCLTGKLHDLLVPLPAGPCADDITGGEPGSERHS